MNAFERMGLPARLDFTEDELQAAFREAGKNAHPDGGGSEAEFAALGEAIAILSSPARRLGHWMEMKGLAVEKRGVIGVELMDLFSIVGEAMQQAEALIRKRDEAKSSLARAMLEGGTQRCREFVEAALAKVQAAIDRECGRFPGLESDPADGSVTVRNLTFLEKWRANLRGCYGRLV